MNQTRGIYQPLAEKVPLYDLADEEIDEERSRVPLLIVIALLVLAAFAGVVWLAYNQGVARGRSGDSIVIAPPEGPIRIAPVDTGPTTPDTGLQIYNQPAPPGQEGASSALAPQTPAIAIAEPPPVRLSPTETPPALPAQAAPQPAPVVAAPAPPQPARQAAVTPPPAPRQAQPAAQPRAATGNSAALSGGAVLQIGSYESEAIANTAWATFKRRHDQAGALSPDIQKADLGAKGIWYRLRVGPYADKSSAAAACAELKAAGVTCLVTSP
jgi:cell division septation protein DedD